MDKALENALARIAALEAGKSAPAAPQPGTFTREQIAQALTSDFIGTLKQLGVPVEYATKVAVAHGLGDQAPPELRTLAQQGPMLSQQMALGSEVQAMRQRLEQFEERERQSQLRTSFNALASDKTKYPFLAAVYAKTPSVIDAELSAHKGDAAALATALETRHKAIAEAAGYIPPASEGNAERLGQSTQAKQAQATGVNGLDPTPPPLPEGAKTGLFKPEDHDALKERILRKYGAQQ